MVAEPALCEPAARIYLLPLGVEFLGLVKILNRFFELTQTGIGFTTVVIGFGRFWGLLDDLVVILDGCRILFLGKVRVTAVVEGIGEFRILPQGFVKVLNVVVILSAFVVDKDTCF